MSSGAGPSSLTLNPKPQTLQAYLPSLRQTFFSHPLGAGQQLSPSSLPALPCSLSWCVRESVLVCVWSVFLSPPCSLSCVCPPQACSLSCCASIQQACVCQERELCDQEREWAMCLCMGAHVVAPARLPPCPDNTLLSCVFWGGRRL